MRRIAVVLALAAVLVGGCGPSAVSNPRALIIGDSILASAQAQVTEGTRRAGWQPVVAGIPGSRIENWPELTARSVTFGHPAIAVVELGTNNCSLGGQCTGMQGQIDQLMVMLKPVQKVLWLNVQEDVPTHANAKFVNAQLEEAARRWPKISIVDLSGTLAEHPEWHLPDRVHLNARGQLALAKLIVGAMEPYNPSH